MRGRVETLSAAHPTGQRPGEAFAIRGKNPNNLRREHGEQGLVAGNLCPLAASQLVFQALRRGRLDPPLAVEDVLVPVQCCGLSIPDLGSKNRNKGEG